MGEETEKFVSRVKLLPAAKEELETFFNKNFEQLQDGSASAQIKLNELLQKLLQPELKAMIKDVFYGVSDYALVVENFPEREGLEQGVKNGDSFHEPLSQDSYAYYIGKALYEISNVEPIWEKTIGRTRESTVYNGREIHRDTGGMNLAIQSNCIIFSCPYNAEHAPTEIIYPVKALESISPEIRGSVKVDYITKSGEKISGNVGTLLEALKIPVSDLHSVSIIKSVPNDQFEQACVGHSTKVDIQPGELVLVNEKTMFHRAHSGQLDRVPPNAFYSRLVTNHSGRTPAYLR